MMRLYHGSTKNLTRFEPGRETHLCREKGEALGFALWGAEEEVVFVHTVLAAPGPIKDMKGEPTPWKRTWASDLRSEGFRYAEFTHVDGMRITISLLPAEDLTIESSVEVKRRSAC